MSDVLLGALVLAAAVGIAWLVLLAREQRIQTRTVRLLAGLCGLGLLVMLLSDWPWEVLSDFWAGHSVVAGILSTVLLVGIVFLAFEDSERRTQERLDVGVTSAGLGGIVDHVVDVEVALGLVSNAVPPDQVGWPGWDAADKPLRWLRVRRERLHADGRRLSASDPRLNPPVLPRDEGQEWRTDLIDQCVRRLLAAIRDWSPVIRGSRNGVMVLIAISEVRKDLMELGELVSEAQEAEHLLMVLRQRMRLLAHFLESQSGARPMRPEVLRTLHPLPRWAGDLDWAADEHGRAHFDRRWRDSLRSTQRELEWSA